MSLDNHKRGCTCSPCVSRRSGEANRIAAAELEATRRDIAYFEVMNMGGPDAVLAKARQWGDPGRAIRLIEAAGLNAAGISDRWRAEAPAQFSSNANLFASDPEHSPEAMAALQSGGTAAWKAKVCELLDERAARTNQHVARDRVLWTDRSGQAVVEDNATQPMHAQRSAVSRDWESFPDHASTGTA